MRSRDVLMASERYAALFPFLFLNTQSPPTRSLSSKQSNGTSASRSAFATASPDEPAPITHVFARSVEGGRGSMCGVFATAIARVTQRRSFRTECGDARLRNRWYDPRMGSCSEGAPAFGRVRRGAPAFVAALLPHFAAAAGASPSIASLRRRPKLRPCARRRAPKRRISKAATTGDTTRGSRSALPFTTRCFERERAFRTIGCSSRRSAPTASAIPKPNSRQRSSTRRRGRSEAPSRFRFPREARRNVSGMGHVMLGPSAWLTRSSRTRVRERRARVPDGARGRRRRLRRPRRRPSTLTIILAPRTRTTKPAVPSRIR